MHRSRRALSAAARTVLLPNRSSSTHTTIYNVRANFTRTHLSPSSQIFLSSIKKVGSVVGGSGLLGVALCALPIKAVPDETKSNSVLPEVNPSSLLTKTLIKNAAAVAVESTSALLTQTFVAVIDKYKQLAQDIETLMDLLQQHRHAEKLGYISEELSQAVIAARVTIDDTKHDIQKLEAILSSSLLCLEAASEAAFQAGHEELSMMGRERCQFTNHQLAMTRSVIQKAEHALTKLQVESIQETPSEEENRKVGK